MVDNTAAWLTKPANPRGSRGSRSWYDCKRVGDSTASRAAARARPGRQVLPRSYENRPSYGRTAVGRGG
eukprot:4113406-Prymnesium_polylepis.1